MNANLSSRSSLLKAIGLGLAMTIIQLVFIKDPIIVALGSLNPSN